MRLEPTADRQAPSLQSELLDEKNADRRGLNRWNERFRADGFKVAVADLQTERARPPSNRLVHELDACFHLVVGEPGPDLPALELDVLVVVHTDS